MGVRVSYKQLVGILCGLVVLQWIWMCYLTTGSGKERNRNIVETRKLLVSSDEKDQIDNEGITVNDTDTIISFVDEYLESDPEYDKRKEQLLNELDLSECVGCRSFNFTILIDSYRCLYMPFNKLEIIFLIMSQPSNQAQRMALRQTFLSNIRLKGINYVFILGRSEDEGIENYVSKESAFYNDIVKFDFIDSYENLTIKSVTAFKWVAQRCPMAKYVMKIDDDVWVNTGALLRAAKSDQFIKFIGGFCYNSAAPVREITHKHFVAEHEYPDEIFPPYCNGPSYIMKYNVVKDISIVADYVPLLHIEDVFVGLCLKRLNYSVTHNYKFHRHEGFPHPCYYKSDDVYTFHQLPPFTLRLIWKTDCSRKIDFSKKFRKEENYQKINENLPDFSKRKMCRNCFKFEYDTILGNDVCLKSKFPRVDLFLLIFSRPSNVLNRITIRETYLRPFMHSNPKLGHVFVLGESRENKTNDIIERENKFFGDIVKFDFVDDYTNLTLKTLNAFNWISKQCKNVKYILKIDEDVWFNSKELLQSLDKSTIKFQSVGGECHRNGAPVRHPKSKYYISPKTYAYSNFPPFCAGPSYILKQNVVNDIVKIASNVPFFQLEDVFIGMCLHYLRYNVTYLPTFNTYTNFQFTCWFKSTHVHTFHGVSPSFMRQIWNTDCSGFSLKKSQEAAMQEAKRRLMPDTRVSDPKQQYNNNNKKNN